MLSAIEHGRDANAELAASIASTAIAASEGVDTEQARLYLDLILLSLSESARGALKSMNSLGFEYRSYFARKYVTQGRREVVLELLESRFGPLRPALQEKVLSANRTQLKAMSAQLLSAATLAEAVKPLRSTRPQVHTYASGALSQSKRRQR